MPLLSIIVPAYNEEIRLPAALERIEVFLSQQEYSAEVLVIENGSRDRTLEIAQQAAARLPTFRAIHEDQRGKGRAVKRGMLEARGEFRVICDVDLSVPIEEINRFIPPQMDCDVVIASREASGAVRYNEPAFRHIVGRLFNAVVRILVMPGLQDTQCGFKCFRAAVVEDVFPRQVIDGWTFDVEVLFIARRLGYRIIEIPVPWYHNGQSKVHVMRDLLKVARELIQIRINDLNGIYR